MLDIIREFISVKRFGLSVIQSQDLADVQDALQKRFEPVSKVKKLTSKVHQKGFREFGNKLLQLTFPEFSDQACKIYDCTGPLSWSTTTTQISLYVRQHKPKSVK